MILILFIGLIISLFTLFAYALCRASAKGDRYFGYSEGWSEKKEEMEDEYAG